MSKEKETEKIISDKLNSREFAFDEKAWAGMENLLDAQQKKRRVGFWWYFSASMFVVLVAGAAWFLNSPQDLKDDDVGLQTNNTVSSQNNTVLSQDNTVLSQNNTVSSQNNTVLSQDNTVSSQNNTVSSQDNTVSSQNNTVSSQDNTVSSQDNTVSSQDNTVSSQNNTVSSQDNTVSSQNNTVSSQDNTVSSQNNTVSSQDNAVSSQNNTVLSQDNTVSSQNNTVSSQNSIIIGSEQKDILSAQTKADSAKTAEKSLLTDSVSLAETTTNPLSAPGKETKNAWGVLAGVGYWTPYKTTYGAYTKEGRFGFSGGLYYRRLLHKRWELDLSAIYSSRGALDFDKTYTNTNYAFGIESDKTTVSPKTLHYLNIPFAIRFNATPRSHFYIGAAYYQLLATTSKVTRTIEDSFSSTVVSSEKQTGNHKGFRKNDLAAFIGYEFTLIDPMNLGLQLSYGFYDNTDNNYKYNENDIWVVEFDRNISLQLQLKYDLIRH